MCDPAPPHRRTHGGAVAGVLALVKPLPPKAVAVRPGFTRAKRPRLRSPPADRWAAVQHYALAPSALPPTTSPIRNSIEPHIGGVHMTDHPSAVIAVEAPPRIRPSNYPEPYASLMWGRVKQPLGDLFGLKNFEVNLTRLAPGAASALHHRHS